MIDPDRLPIVVSVWRELHDNAVQKKRFEYVVVASEDIRGKSLDEMKRLSFRVGVSGAKVNTLSAEELTALFMIVRNQAERLGKLAAERQITDEPQPETTLSMTIDLDPTDEQIKSVLSGVQFTLTAEQDRAAGDSGVTQEKPADDHGLTQERVNYVLSLVKRKADAALAGRPGNHFRVYPPAEFLAEPTVIDGPEAYGRLKNTVWWVRWYGDRYDQLRFIELLVFVQQIIAAQMAFEQAQNVVAKHPTAHRASKHSGGWQPKKDRDVKPKKRDGMVHVTVKGNGFAPADLAKDEMVRLLFSKVEVETTARPSQAVN